MKTPSHEVLELFGFGEAHRPHIWREPRLEFGTGRKPTMPVTVEQPGVPRHYFPYDPERLDALHAFAVQLARGVAEGPRL
ncbi:hypothetical protein [Streptomyces sp. DH7]|uniref:hypothetical protein n=1 Tax=Streptomyces sp. DH7 TaxID=2857006 RepID=UPI001E2B9AB5|nr:hypothetical protein [Streptomyces sp. DH7]